MAIVFKHFPLNFHKDAMPAAKASMAAMRQGRFWPYHDLLFENQKALSEKDLLFYAEMLGLDMDKFKADMADPEIEKKIKADMAEGQPAGVRGTPTVFINGRRFKPNGGYTTEAFQKVIDKEFLGK